MGAGKTSAARRLARLCGLASIDMDTYIERKADKKISEIFAEVGEAGFREMETFALREICEMKEPLIISCGGGIVTVPENLEIMRGERSESDTSDTNRSDKEGTGNSTGTIILLKVTAEQAAMRIGNTETRPLFNDIENARARLAEREPLYEQAADITIDTQNRSVRSIAYAIKSALEKKGILCLQQK